MCVQENSFLNYRRGHSRLKWLERTKEGFMNQNSEITDKAATPLWQSEKVTITALHTSLLFERSSASYGGIWTMASILAILLHYVSLIHFHPVCWSVKSIPKTWYQANIMTQFKVHLWQTVLIRSKDTICPWAKQVLSQARWSPPPSLSRPCHYSKSKASSSRTIT